MGEEIVTDARRRVEFPHEGQNLRDASLQILRRAGVRMINNAFRKVGNVEDILEASMTSEYPALYALYPLALDADEAEAHL